MAELTITAKNFEETVLKNEKTVLLDFWATWCGPCQMIAPVVAQIAEELGFSSPQYFSRKFTEIVGVPPSKFVQSQI